MTRGAAVMRRTSVVGAPSPHGAGVERNRWISPRLLSIAARSTRATVGRIMPPSHRAGREVFEPRELVEERQLDAADRPVAVFADDHFGHALLFGLGLFLVVDLGAIDEHDQVGVLFERARFSEIRELRTMIRARLRRAAQLR